MALVVSVLRASPTPLFAAVPLAISSSVRVEALLPWIYIIISFSDIPSMPVLMPTSIPPFVSLAFSTAVPRSVSAAVSFSFTVSWWATCSR